MRYQPIAATALALVLVGAGAISASAVDWDGGAGPGALNWSNALNWNPDAVPAASSALVFSTGGTVANFDLGDGYLVGGLTFNNAAGFTIHHAAGQGIALTGDLNTLTGGQVYDLDVPVTVTPAASTWNIAGADQLAVSQPITINPGSTVDFLVQTNSYISFGALAPVNGGAATKDGGGVVTFLGGGTISDMTINNGVVHTSSLTPNMDVTNEGGYLTGGQAGLVNALCAQQQVGGVDLEAGYIGPGDDDLFGGGIGRMCLNGTFHGLSFSTYLADVEGATSDVIHTTGVFDPNGSFLDLTTGTAPAINTELTIAEAAGGVSATLFRDQNGDPIADNAVFETTDGQFYRMDYRTTTIVLTYLGTTAPVDPAAPALAATGVDAGTVIVLAGFLLLGGTGAILVATRRREV